MRFILFFSALLVVTMPAVVSQPAGLASDQPYRLFERYEQSDSQQFALQKLNALANYLVVNPDDEAWLISYAGRISCRLEAKRRASAMKQYLLLKRVRPSQIKIKDGGFRDDWSVDMWLKSRWGKLNPPSEPTVKVTQVRVVKNRRCREIGKKLTDAKR